MGSPRLECLELHDCSDFYRLDIVSESLKKLVTDSYYREPEWDDLLELEIVAPRIEVKVDLEIPIDFDFEDEEDLFEAYENIVRELFESLHKVKKIVVGKWFLLVSFS